MLSCLDLGTMASEDLCGEGGHSSGQLLPEASVAAVAVVIAIIQVNSGAPPKVASSTVSPISASGRSQAAKPAPVVIPRNSRTSSFSYLADLTPSGNLGELVSPGPVKIYGSIYPKSISFYCNDGDPTAYPAYKLKQNTRWFKATVGLEAKWPPHFLAGVILVGDGHTLRTFSVSVLRPKTVDINVTGIHILQLECFSSGMTSASEGWGRCCSVGQRTCLGRTLTAEWRGSAGHGAAQRRALIELKANSASAAALSQIFGILLAKTQ